MIPEKDSSKWKEYEYDFLKHTLKFKYIGRDGVNEYKTHKKRVSVFPLKSKGWVIFFGEWYDSYEYPYFDIMASLNKYEFNFGSTPDFEQFQKKHLSFMMSSEDRKREKLEHEIKTIHGVQYLHLIFYDSKGRIRGETYRTPINGVVYLDIGASYKEDPPTGTKGWLKNRRKLFKEFAENVILTKPAEKKAPANAND